MLRKDKNKIHKRERNSQPTATEENIALYVSVSLGVFMYCVFIMVSLSPSCKKSFYCMFYLESQTDSCAFLCVFWRFLPNFKVRFLFELFEKFSWALTPKDSGQASFHCFCSPIPVQIHYSLVLSFLMFIAFQIILRIEMKTRSY